MDDDVDNGDNNKLQYTWVIASFQFVPFFQSLLLKEAKQKKKVCLQKNKSHEYSVLKE